MHSTMIRNFPLKLEYVDMLSVVETATETAQINVKHKVDIDEKKNRDT